MTQQQTVAAGTLQPGDKVVYTNEIVIGRSAGVRTPAGKVDVTLKRGDAIRTAQWRRSTFIRIERES